MSSFLRLSPFYHVSHIPHSVPECHSWGYRGAHASEFRPFLRQKILLGNDGKLAESDCRFHDFIGGSRTPAGIPHEERENKRKQFPEYPYRYLLSVAAFHRGIRVDTDARAAGRHHPVPERHLRTPLWRCVRLCRHCPRLYAPVISPRLHLRIGSAEKSGQLFE